MSAIKIDRRFVILFLMIGLSVAVASFSFAQTSTNYRIWMDVTGGGGGESSSGNYQSLSIIGQPTPIGPSNCSGYHNYPGLLNVLRGDFSEVFGDIPPGYWAYDYIKAIYDGQITAGCSVDPLEYCPDNSVTREQMAVFLIRALDQVPADGYCGAMNAFSDVTFDRWSCKYVKRLAELSITTGYGDGRFGPEDSVTREQMAVFITKALASVPPDGYCGTADPFTDVSFDRWSCKYVKELAELGITTGYGDGRFGPGDYVTRAQMAVFLARAFLGM